MDPRDFYGRRSQGHHRKSRGSRPDYREEHFSYADHGGTGSSRNPYDPYGSAHQQGMSGRPDPRSRQMDARGGEHAMDGRRSQGQYGGLGGMGGGQHGARGGRRSMGAMHGDPRARVPNNRDQIEETDDMLPSWEGLGHRRQNSFVRTRLYPDEYIRGEIEGHSTQTPEHTYGGRRPTRGGFGDLPPIDYEQPRRRQGEYQGPPGVFVHDDPELDAILVGSAEAAVNQLGSDHYIDHYGDGRYYQG